MVRHPTARRVRRPVESSDDAFVAGVLETTVWAKKHGRILIIAAIAVALVLGGLIWWRFDRQSRIERAATELMQVRQSFLMGNFALAAGELEAFVATYGGTPAGREARVLLGQTYLELGQPERAIDAVAPEARDPAEPLGATAAFLKATAHEVAQQSTEAERIYLRIAERGRFLYERLEALEMAARIRIERGDVSGGAELYERGAAMIPEDRQVDRSIFEMRAAEARAMATPGSTQGGG